MVDIIFILLSVLFVFFCAVFVAAEFSFVAVNRAEVDKKAKESARARELQGALKNLSTHLSAAQIGITLTNLLIGFLAGPAIVSLILPGEESSLAEGIAIAGAFVATNLFTMLFGELIPKNIAISRPYKTALQVEKLQRGFTKLFYPAVSFSNNIANKIIRRVGIEPSEELLSARSPEEIISLTKRSAEKGTLPAPTAMLLKKSILFGKKTAHEAMTPRSRVVSLGPEASIDDAISLARDTGLSRFPVIGEDKKEVLGILHLKYIVGAKGDVNVSEVMKEALYVPETMELDPLLNELRASSLQIAIVVDEFGDFAGVITLEDLLEEILGEIRDEHDRESLRIIQVQPGIYNMSGLLRPDEIFEETGIALPEKEVYETLAGAISHKLQRLPGIGDAAILSVAEGEIRCKVEKMDGLRIDRVSVEKL